MAQVLTRTAVAGQVFALSSPAEYIGVQCEVAPQFAVNCDGADHAGQQRTQKYAGGVITASPPNHASQAITHKPAYALW